MKAIRLIRYKGFQDSGWIHLNKITLLFGLNSSGKSSLLNALLMLKQSLQNPALEVPFTFATKKGVDIGNYPDVSFKHILDQDQPVEIMMKLDLGHGFSTGNKKVRISGEDIVFKISIGFNEKRETIMLLGFSFFDNEGRNLLSMKRDPRNKEDTFSSDVFSQVPNKGVILDWYNFIPVVVHNPDQNNLILLSAISKKIREKLIEAFDKLVHVGPLRSEAQRMYQFTGENPSEVGRGGEDAINLLYLDRHEEQKTLTEKVNKWLKEYQYEFSWQTFGGFFQLILRDTRSGLEVNLKDVGFGISQILPVIIQGYLNNPDQIILVEQPEIHLHAGAQAKLGDMFIDMVGYSGKTFLIETHSEHLLLRLRRRVAESTLMGQTSEYPLAPEHLAVNFVENRVEGSIVHHLQITDTGQFMNIPDAFRSFFADDFEETMKLTEAIAAVKLQRHKETE